MGARRRRFESCRSDHFLFQLPTPHSTHGHVFYAGTAGAILPDVGAAIWLVAHGLLEATLRECLDKCVGKWVVGNDGGECLVALAAVSFFPPSRYFWTNRLRRLKPSVQFASAVSVLVVRHSSATKNYFFPANQALPRNDEFRSRLVALPLLRAPDQSNGGPSVGKQ